MVIYVHNYHIQEISLTPNEQQEYNLITAEMMTHYREIKLNKVQHFMQKLVKELIL